MHIYRWAKVLMICGQVISINIYSISENRLILDDQSKLEENHFQFCASVDKPEYIESDTYKKVVESLPICCVDVFVYNPQTKKYLVVLRRDRPAQYVSWVPGGRLLKGESFFAGAERKIQEETGLAIVAQHTIDVYSTLFGDSQWDCQTHTINIVVFAELKPDQNVSLDAHHESYHWVSRDTPPTNEYLLAAYAKARSYMQ